MMTNPDLVVVKQVDSDGNHFNTTPARYVSSFNKLRKVSDPVKVICEPVLLDDEFFDNYLDNFSPSNLELATVWMEQEIQKRFLEMMRVDPKHIGMVNCKETVDMATSEVSEVVDEVFRVLENNYKK